MTLKEQGLLTRKQLAAAINCGVRTVDRMREMKLIRPIVIGRAKYYDLAGIVREARENRNITIRPTTGKGTSKNLIRP